MAPFDATSPMQELAQRIAAIEEAYEFMLAYAAQGRRNEQNAPEPGIRSFLGRMDAALDGIGEVAAEAGRLKSAGPVAAVVAILAEDARKARILVQFVQDRPAVSSQLVDNLNASIHLRSVLTDLFLIDEGLKIGEV